MGAYQPASRRPIASALRRTADRGTRWCVRRGIHPDTISYASVAASAAAGVCFWQSGSWAALLIPAVGFCYLRLWFNMLDGMVALASGKASLRGELLNDLPDRISDVMIFVGAAHSGLCHALSGYWAAILALLVAYVGMFGQALGVQREFSGVMAKPWRMVTLHIGAWITLGLLWGGCPIYRGRLSVLDWTFLLMIAGCLQTVIVRLKRILAALRAKTQAPSL